MSREVTLLIIDGEVEGVYAKAADAENDLMWVSKHKRGSYRSARTQIERVQREPLRAKP